MDGFRIAPEPLQLVVSAGLFREDMHQKIAVIHQDPFGIGEAFHADGTLSFVLQALGHFIGDRLNLLLVGTGANDKRICERSDVAQIKNFDVGSFFAFGSSDGG